MNPFLCEPPYENKIIFILLGSCFLRGWLMLWRGGFIIILSSYYWGVHVFENLIPIIIVLPKQYTFTIYASTCNGFDVVSGDCDAGGQLFVSEVSAMN